jgi:hypothetical protein
LGDYIAGALLDAVVGFTVAELDEAGKVAFGAKLEGSVGDRYGEPAPHHTLNLSIPLALSPPKESIMVAHSAGGVRDTTGTTWSALIRGFKLALIVEGLRPHTIHNYTLAVERFANGLPKAPNKITHSDIREYTLHSQADGYVAKTIYEAQLGVRKFFRFLLAEGEIRRDPTADMKLVRYRVDRSPPTTPQRSSAC